MTLISPSVLTSTSYLQPVSDYIAQKSLREDPDEVHMVPGHVLRLFMLMLFHLHMSPVSNIPTSSCLTCSFYPQSAPLVAANVLLEAASTMENLALRLEQIYESDGLHHTLDLWKWRLQVVQELQPKFDVLGRCIAGFPTIPAFLFTHITFPDFEHLEHYILYSIPERNFPSFDELSAIDHEVIRYSMHRCFK